jgi:hypothetical protein
VNRGKAGCLREFVVALVGGPRGIGRVNSRGRSGILQVSRRHKSEQTYEQGLEERGRQAKLLIRSFPLLFYA